MTLSTKDVSALLGESMSTIQKKCRLGEIVAEKVGNKWAVSTFENNTYSMISNEVCRLFLHSVSCPRRIVGPQSCVIQSFETNYFKFRKPIFIEVAFNFAHGRLCVTNMDGINYDNLNEQFQNSVKQFITGGKSL
jgi:hypothetical protein